jgi:hypothetical protein
VSTVTHRTLTEDDFLARFKPVANHIDPNGGFEGCVFETFGKELAYVQSQNCGSVWTVLDCDGQLRIESGFHFVNRVGYLIASTAIESGHTYSVVCEDLSERGNGEIDALESLIEIGEGGAV